MHGAVQGRKGEAVAKVLGIGPGNVEIEVTTLGGGFGRRAHLDFVRQAAAIAKAADGAPVQTLWSREQDMAHDYYRPAFVARYKGGLDANGKLIAWHAESAGSSMVATACGSEERICSGNVIRSQ